MYKKIAKYFTEKKILSTTMFKNKKKIPPPPTLNIYETLVLKNFSNMKSISLHRNYEIFIIPLLLRRKEMKRNNFLAFFIKIQQWTKWKW